MVIAAYIVENDALSLIAQYERQTRFLEKKLFGYFSWFYDFIIFLLFFTDLFVFASKSFLMKNIIVCARADAECITCAIFFIFEQIHLPF